MAIGSITLPSYRYHGRDICTITLRPISNIENNIHPL